MAQKEATVYIVDCGRSMGEHAHGRKQSNLDWALEYVWDKITATVATGRKTTLAGVVGLRTDGTDNSMSHDEDYEHITVFQELSQLLMPNLKKLSKDLVVSRTKTGDAISALVVAIQMIATTCKKLQYIRKIVLITDARAFVQADGLSSITKKIKDDNIELIVLGVDFDDLEYGFKEEGKDATKAENEEVLRTLCEDCGGVFGTLAQAIEEMSMPRVKSTRPVPSYKGLLTLGNPQTFDTALSINVERYPKVMQAKPPTASRFVVRGDMTTSQAATDASSATLNGDDGLAAVKSARTYQVEDEEAPGGKRDVEFDELSKGYEYGRTAVHISESDRNVTTYETTASMDIVGFVDRARYERYLEMDRACLIIGQRSDGKSTMALSALIHALYELDSYAVARLVVKENKEPRMLLLAPNIEPEFECLYDIELPFAEDVRSYKFPPLDRVVTVSGKTLTLHRNLPNNDLQTAMDAYVDNMDLSTFGKDADGQEVEYAPMDETFSPMLHRINQVIKHRAIFPTADPPPTSEILIKYSHPPQQLISQNQSTLNKLIAAAEVKKVPPKARGKRFGRKGRNGEADKPLSELDVTALLAADPKRSTKRLDPQNAIPEFKQLLATSEDESLTEVKEACIQLQTIISNWLRHSVGDSGYGRAIEALRVMREEILDYEQPELYNGMLRALKGDVLEGKLGGDRKDFWYQVRVNRLGLIRKSEMGASEVGDEEAREFMLVK
ncbi:SPOC like C-terminal domain-containing protein [Neohortaea acidophila]|uniref:ATP-dependent DNA helicase II subunit 2 n=1 Tax=Neohortaea acidophila TaxID=245834 RepID=A0A6A6Q473_9PEZI|nr:SPOC like C-terminal domain-containing protein [Neohortaea acidophila]KAF2486453.1 SPOC like C-terminal domain-containing protein [Neohortaea acidophila]